MKKAIFLDRDGTIIEERGHIKAADEVVFINNVFASLGKLQEHYELFIVTNQSGVAKKIITNDDVENVNKYILEVMQSYGIHITAVYVCPHDRADGCKCIKPKSFFLKKAEKEHNIDLRNSFSLGDHPHDVELANNVGGQGIFLLTGHGRKHLHELAPSSMVFENINEASEWIMSKNSNKLSAF